MNSSHAVFSSNIPGSTRNQRLVAFASSTPLQFRLSRISNISPCRPHKLLTVSCVAAASGAQPGRSNDDVSSASQNVNTPPPAPPPSVYWETLNGCDVVLPADVQPKAIVRFTGGLGAGIAPRALYGLFLEEIVRRGDVAIIAVPVFASFNHEALAKKCARQLGEATQELLSRWNLSWIPCFGMGHSLGAKIQILAGCYEDARQSQGPGVANILLSFNNFSVSQSIPMWETFRDGVGSGTDKSAEEVERLGQFLENLDLSGLGLAKDNERGKQALDRASTVLRKIGETITTLSDGMSGAEFKPTQAETLKLLQSKYSVRENLIVSFSRDSLDQQHKIEPALKKRFGARGAILRKLNGTHVTPLTPSIDRGTDSSNGFATVGSVSLDDELRKTAGSINEELDATVAVVVAYLRLHLEVLAEKKMLPTELKGV